MTTKRDLLIEIGTEELPPKALKPLATAFAEEIHNGLEKLDLSHGDYQWFATPRRLAVIVNKLVLRQQDHEQIKRGPALKAAYDDEGKPSKALEGFARSCNAGVKELETKETDKGSWLIFRSLVKGQATADLLPQIIDTALARLPIPKRMRWGDGDVEFVRPVHWSIVLLGREIIPCKILNTQSGNETRGHRFHHPKTLKITSASAYVKKLKEKAYVIVDFSERKELIRTMVNNEAIKHGYSAHIDPDLLDEVTSLVEWPVAITGSFDKEFLHLPREVLLATMQDHQKYFPITDSNGQLLANFITISNIESKFTDEIKKGNERVIRPRLSDATFFWQRDCAKPLADYSNGLKGVIYQKKLGTLYDKTDRLIKLSVFIASELGLKHDVVERAASLAKCDLLTDMVGEFPELQGTMGKYYALRSNETEELAKAIEEQYLPRHAGDCLPESDAGKILAIADKMDILSGHFGIGQEPTGDKDPFGLRRAALGVIRILIEGQVAIPLKILVDGSFSVFDIKIAATNTEVENFIYNRLSGYMKNLGFSALEVESVICKWPQKIHLVPQLLEAVRAFSKLPQAESLVAANKRVVNILKQAETNGESFVNANLEILEENSERELFKILSETSRNAIKLLNDEDFTGYLKSFAILKEPIDNFFDSVMVMVEDDSLRENRLALLTDLRDAMNKVADISRLQR